MEKTSGQRLDYLDLAKAIAIVCMVWLHVGTIFEITDRIVHVFHMPVFFLISGQLFKPGKGFGSFIRRKTSSLLVPYCFWGCAFYLIWTCIYCLMGDLNSIISVKVFIFSLLYYNAEISPYGCVQWFFTTLFFSNILFYVIVLVSKSNMRIVCCLTVLSGLIGSLMFLIPVRLPLGLDIAFMAVFFMGIGYCLRNFKMKWYKAAVLLLSVIFCFLLNAQCLWNMRLMEYGISVLYMIGCAACCIFILFICRALCSKINGKYLKPFLFLGKNSVWFLLFNNFYINLMRILFPDIPNYVLLSLVIALIVPSIFFGNRFLYWTIGKKTQKNNNVECYN